MIDLKEILINSNYKKETEELINIANLAYKHWATYWTGFNSTYVCEEIIKDFGKEQKEKKKKGLEKVMDDS